MHTLSSVVDPQLLIGIAIAAMFSIVVSMFSLFQRPVFLGAICVMGSAAFYRWAFAGFLVVIVVAYGTLCLLNRQAPGEKRWRWACMAMLVLLTVFTLGRALHWDRSMALQGPVPLVVYSLDMWLALRLVTLFWEVGSGAAPMPQFSRYILWSCLPLTVVGPVLRFSKFPTTICTDRSLWKSSTWWMEAAAGAAKLITGPMLIVLQRFMETRWPQAHWFTAGAATLVTGPLGFYFTVAGYLQLVEAFSRPCGFALPVSFNSPIGRENISAFWANWNMTATAVFRDYLFYNRWGLSTYNVYFNTIILFLLVGLWHSVNAYWLLWGFLHGLFFCTFLLWRKFNNRLGFLPLRGTIVSRTAARTLTYVAVCACWYLPSKILQRLPVA